MAFEYPIKTRYVETAQDGIIHHSSYVVYLEIARIEYFHSKGFDINEMERQGILCPAVELSLRYIKPLRSLEDIIVRVSVHTCSKVRFQILHEIFRSGEKVAYGITTHCFINSSFKPIKIPDLLLEAFMLDMQKG